MPKEDYLVDCLLGKGSFGEVYKGKNLHTGQTFALKIIDLEEASDVRDLIKEIHFLSRVRSPHLTRYYETFLQDTKMWIVLEYCGGGSCSDLLKCFGKLREPVACFILRDVLHGLEYLHGQRKVHRDIKLANILLTDDGKVKLADFGVSGEMSLTRTKRNTLVGTPYWMAPEVISHSAKGYDTKADIWSTGITAIEFVTGHPPLSSVEPMEALFKIPSNKPPELEGIHFSEDIKDFVRYCLIKSAKQRPSASLLLHHRFISTCPGDVDIGELLLKKQARELNLKKKKTKPAHQAKVERNPSIHWNFTATLSGAKHPDPVPPPVAILQPQQLSVYGNFIHESLSKVMARAKTKVARACVENLRDEFSRAEQSNVGLCHAFIEELRVLIDDYR
ncbi:Pkinase-domain-containing protein [Metschnikowia bicuspidata var. bicuspidata NRRL YB-4993]|uniref:non-specific serine/threonine protein kinase n=1 Tax=Metschnikowia bicuspidata var. bicuspidata NRRL YB-4993 TaxID=869754 RepID=A0A1A0H267_9ASCO|nr:Pkinase-domain-containing protein [Metschnikowia bicuspidata var. bicuspidata NRRL YB-4993]OBA18045.1 Pkinase-domain-containing protein [Metschnikowia bicuspidata var. bicuspidata NRRL YB-4993]